MTQKEPDEKELLEILELAKEAEQKARKMCESITVHAEKWRLKAEAKCAAAAQKRAGGTGDPSLRSGGSAGGETQIQNLKPKIQN